LHEENSKPEEEEEDKKTAIKQAIPKHTESVRKVMRLGQLKKIYLT
jgi:hypothetical protein